MSRFGVFLRSWRGGLAAFAVLFGTAAPSARADLIHGTDSNGSSVAVYVNFFTIPGGTKATLDVSDPGGQVVLSTPAVSQSYGILFGMTVNGNSVPLDSILANNPTPPDPNTGVFDYSPQVNGQTFHVHGVLTTPGPTDPNSWNAVLIPGIPQFPEAALVTFNLATPGDPMMSFIIDDPNGNVIHFADLDSKSPEPASLCLAGFGVLGLAGYGWRRRKAV